MHFMLLLHYVPGTGPAPDSPEQEAEYAEWEAVERDMQTAGVFVANFAVQGPETARTLRPGGERADGTATGADLTLFAVYVVDVEDADAAATWAAKLPHAWYGATEIRPLM